MKAKRGYLCVYTSLSECTLINNVRRDFITLNLCWGYGWLPLRQFSQYHVGIWMSRIFSVDTHDYPVCVILCKDSLFLVQLLIYVILG